MWTHDEGMARGIERDIEKGRTEGMVRGIEKDRTEGVVASLARLFARTLGRPLTATESATRSDRYHRLGADRLDAVLLDLRVANLAAWLADPDAH